jgi:hypothetical protein
MNRDFLSNFEPENKKAQTETTEETTIPINENDDEFTHHDYIRNISFIWPDGKWHFMNYSRLDSGSIDAEQTLIRLSFGSETIELIGVRLLPLLKSLIAQRKKYIYCDDERYNQLHDDDAVVNNVILIQNQ